MENHTAGAPTFICKVVKVKSRNTQNNGGEYRQDIIRTIIRDEGENGCWTGAGRLIKSEDSNTGKAAIEVHVISRYYGDKIIGYVPEDMVKTVSNNERINDGRVTVGLSYVQKYDVCTAKLYTLNIPVKALENSRLSAEEKRNLLLQRGFTVEEIEGGFEDYIKDPPKWTIKTVGPKEVSETYDTEVIAKLFVKDSVQYSWTCTVVNFGFKKYSSIHKNSRENLPNASALDPFVARLVFAVNECCIFTLMSCDGWHERDYGQRELKLWMQSRYDTVWFWIIAERVFGETGPRKYPDYNRSKNWINSFEPENKLHRGVEGTKVICHIKHLDAPDIYKRINQYACFLEETSDELCAIREKWIASLQSEKSDREIDYQKFPELKEMILASVEEDLQQLHHKWNEVHQELEEKSREGVQAWDFCYY